MTTFRIASVNAERMKAMSLLVEDPNPIHFYPEAAAAAGLGDRVVNPGACNLGYLLNAVLAIDPAVRIERLTLALQGNVLAEDEVVAATWLQEESDEDGERRLRCGVSLDVTGGARAIEGTVVVTVPTR